MWSYSLFKIVYSEYVSIRHCAFKIRSMYSFSIVHLEFVQCKVTQYPALCTQNMFNSQKQHLFYPENNSCSRPSVWLKQAQTSRSNKRLNKLCGEPLLWTQIFGHQGEFSWLFFCVDIQSKAGRKPVGWPIIRLGESQLGGRPTHPHCALNANSTEAIISGPVVTENTLPNITFGPN
jgi:hypothetical protein